jgi:hypothetical protein
VLLGTRRQDRQGQRGDTRQFSHHCRFSSLNYNGLFIVCKITKKIAYRKGNLFLFSAYFVHLKLERRKIAVFSVFGTMSRRMVLRVRMVLP